MSEHNGRPAPEDATPPELRAVEHAIEKIAEADRSSTPADLEQRVIARTRPVLHRRVIHAARDAARSTGRRRPFLARPGTLAASVATLALALGLVMIVGRSQAQPQPRWSMDDAMDVWVAADDPLEIHGENVGRGIDLLFYEAALLNRDVAEDWTLGFDGIDPNSM